MAKESTTKRGCPYRCPLCALYDVQEIVQDGIVQCVPAEARAHLNRAAREMLFAIRGLLEKGLGTLGGEPKPGSRRKAQKVKVE